MNIDKECSDPADDESHEIEARDRLEKASSLKLWHSLTILLSIGLTLFAWHYSRTEQQAKIRQQFEREADQVVDLIQERMQRYEDALWGGVAFFDVNDHEMTADEWRRYVEGLQLQRKYPGINGIGVVHAVPDTAVADYLAHRRQERPDFHIHPTRDGQERLPISWIVPVEGNEQAIGLDTAHEANRRTAATKARDCGTTQITGPITLVQDSEHTPGFLLFAPFYTGQTQRLESDRKGWFKGLVYAPFVVKKLMKGTLEKKRRRVGIQLSDGTATLYNEHDESAMDYDPNPIFKSSRRVQMYGRTWTFDIWSTRSFRHASTASQPWMILVGGILIDCLLFGVFLAMSRSSRRSLQYADLMTQRLKKNSQKLELQTAELAKSNNALTGSNLELQQFAYVASHDLQSPLRGVANLAGMLKEDYAGQIDETLDSYLDRIVAGANRMQQLIIDLLNYSRVDSRSTPFHPVCLNEVFEDVVELIAASIHDTDAEVTKDHLPIVAGDRSQLTQLLQNLIGNGIKYHGASAPKVHVSADLKGDKWTITVRDNGIGIAPSHHDRIFEIFGRLHSQKEYPGTGIGLAVCRRITQRHGGKIWLDSPHGIGSSFHFQVPSTSHVAASSHEAEDSRSELAHIG